MESDAPIKPAANAPHPQNDAGPSLIIFVVAAYIGSFAIARLCRVIGVALCGVGHGGGGPLGERFIIASIGLYCVAFFSAIASLVSAWRLKRRKLPVVALGIAIVASILAELRDVSHMF